MTELVIKSRVHIWPAADLRPCTNLVLGELGNEDIAPEEAGVDSCGVMQGEGLHLLEMARTKAGRPESSKLVKGRCVVDEAHQHPGQAQVVQRG